MFILLTSLGIVIDPNYAGNLGEGLYAHKFWGFKKNNKEYSGVFLNILVDERDVKEDLYIITFVEGTNRAILTKPTLEATFRLDKTEYDVRQAEETVKVGEDAMRAAHTKMIRNNPDSKVKRFDLIFPEGFQLSQRVFDGPSGIEGERITAAHKLVAYRKNTGMRDVANVDLYRITTRLTWRFDNLAACTELLVDTGGVGQRTVEDGFQGM